MALVAWFLPYVLLLSASVAGESAPPAPPQQPLAALPEAVDRLPVLHMGRVKPFAVAAQETITAITGKSWFAPLRADGSRDSSRRWPATALVLAALTDPAWNSVPLLHVPYAPLQAEMGSGEWISLAAVEPHIGRIAALSRRRQEAKELGRVFESSRIDTALLELGSRFSETSAWFTGFSFGLAPLAPDATARAWVIEHREALLAASGEDRRMRDWSDTLREIAARPTGLTEAGLADADLWLNIKELAFSTDPRLEGWPGPATAARAWGEALTKADGVAAQTAALTDALRTWGQRRDGDQLARHLARLEKQLPSNPPGISYPNAASIDLELWYHRGVGVGSLRYGLFTWAWIAFLAGGLLAAWGLAKPAAGTAVGATASRLSLPLLLGAVLTVVGCLLTATGLGCRVAITGLGAVTNLYETLIWVALLVAVLGLGLALATRQGLYAVAGGVGAGLCAMIGEAIPPELGSQIGQLQPVLRSQFWLWTHVKVVVGAYAPFTLAWVLGNILLARAAFAGRAVTAGEQLLLYRCLQIGVLLMAAGTILGAIWADQAWGRYWGWDPKEVYALVVVLTYLIPLHLRYVGLVGPTGLALWSVFGFLSVVMSWYGVNFVLGVGLHAYAFGSGGAEYAFVLCGAQAAFAAVCWWRITRGRAGLAA
ncbi:hypothetical protein LBMAG53_36170 [Planctomycetota bacterium]|nr:hypothetical protein LBMAG53_36170 [Planctomycetota bacterium]